MKVEVNSFFEQLSSSSSLAKSQKNLLIKYHYQQLYKFSLFNFT